MSESSGYLQAVGGGLPRTDLTATNPALVVVDIQYADAHPEFGIGVRLRQELPDKGRYFFDRIDQVVVPNVSRLQATFRAIGLPVINVRVRNRFADGRDSSRRFRAFGMVVPPHSREAQFLDGVGPHADDLVVDKVTSSPFASTDFDERLRLLGVDALVVTGVVTNYCVENTVREAADRDYQVVLVSDGCAAHSVQAEHDAWHRLDRVMTTVVDTQSVVDSIQSRGTNSAS